tara:strand:+ start:4732 stop:4875 length:144 start_codon:yes stop_codon:yes gene_type:complete
MQSHNNDNDAGDNAECPCIACNELAGNRRSGSEQNEYGGESKHETGG